MGPKDFHILLVEDHRIIGKAMTLMLTSIKCKVSIAITGTEALDLFQTNDFDLILMDIGLLDSNGLSVAEKMRNSDNQKKAKTPIAIITAHTDSVFKNQAKVLGIDDFIVKPCTMDTCNNLVKKYRNPRKFEVISQYQIK